MTLACRDIPDIVERVRVREIFLPFNKLTEWSVPCVADNATRFLFATVLAFLVGTILYKVGKTK